MAVSLLLGALAKAGGGDLVKQIAGGAGKAVLGKIADRYGLDVNDPAFDETAADRLAADQESNRFVAEMRGLEVDAFKTKVADAQHARSSTLGAREKMSMDHQQKVDVINLWESIAMSLGGLLFVVGLIIFLIWMKFKHADVELDDFTKTIITAMLTWITKDLVSQRSNYKWGSTEGSSRKNATIQAALEREQDQDEMEIKQTPKIVETVSTTRPIHSPAQAAPQPAAPAPAPAPEMDEIDAAMADTVSTTRPGSNGDNIL